MKVLASEPAALESVVNVVVLHETNGRKYLEAVVELSRLGRIGSIRFVEASIVWKFFHSLVRERRTFKDAVAQMLTNLKFRFTAALVRHQIVIVGLPPFDPRFVLYALLLRRNQIIYNTSWPDWNGTQVPRRMPLLRPLLQRLWRSTLASPNVSLTAVTTVAADGLRTFVPGKAVTVIPHVVSEAFFEGHARFSRPFRLLFVGELVESRGLYEIEKMLPFLGNDLLFSLDVIGDGPLRDVAKRLTAATGGIWHGKISDRRKLVQVVTSSHVLLSLSVKTPRWQELFGMAIIESMACGVPCIASDHVGGRSLIEDGKTGFLLPEHSPRETAAHIRDLYENESAWVAMSTAARERAGSNRIVDVARRWDDVIEEAKKREIAGEAR